MMCPLDKQRKATGIDAHGDQELCECGDRQPVKLSCIGAAINCEALSVGSAVQVVSEYVGVKHDVLRLITSC
jgi:hypothetical protein